MMKKTINNGKNAAPASEPDRRIPGIYVHIPFCVRKCLYCDFASYSGCSGETQERYFKALYKEAELLFPDGKMPGWQGRIADNADKDREPAPAPPADTLFVGGGTPTSVYPRYIADLVKRLPLAEEAEMTIESNPGTLTPEKIDVYRRAGFNRLSIGVQSFEDSELKLLGRIHDAAEAERTIRMAREHGFGNINIDLMFGFPGQTMDTWKRTLDKAMSLQPEHISFYSLQIEEGTPFYDMFRSGILEQLPDELNREMYHYAVSFLREHGFVHYEISNAALPGRECRHNLKYWTMRPYFGLGSGAHSFDGSTRHFNPDGIEEYCSSIEAAGADSPSSVRNYARGAGGGSVPSDNVSEEAAGFELEDQDDLISDCMFTGLRLIKGVADEDFRRLFGIGLMDRFGEQIEKYTGQGLMTFEKGMLAFTERGLDISNSVLMDFI